MKTSRAEHGATGLMIAICMSLLSIGVKGQNACEVDCVQLIYANNCGQASCITGVGSSADYDALCGPACISAISGGSMLDCLTSIGGSVKVQNSFVLTVQNFCAEGDPFKAEDPPILEYAPTPEPSTSKTAPEPETATTPTDDSIPPTAESKEPALAPSPSSQPAETIEPTAATEPNDEIEGAPEPEWQLENLLFSPSEFL